MKIDKEAIKKEILLSADCQKEVVALKEAEATVLKLQEQLSIYRLRIKTNSSEIENAKVYLRQTVARGGSVEKIISRRVTCQNEVEALVSLCDDLEATVIPDAQAAITSARNDLIRKLVAGISVVKSAIETGLNEELAKMETTLEQWGDLHFALVAEFAIASLPGSQLFISNREIKNALGA